MTTVRLRNEMKSMPRNSTFIFIVQSNCTVIKGSIMVLNKSIEPLTTIKYLRTFFLIPFFGFHGTLSSYQERLCLCHTSRSGFEILTPRCTFHECNLQRYTLHVVREKHSSGVVQSLQVYSSSFLGTSVLAFTGHNGIF